MLSYCLKYRKNIANKNLKMVKAKNGGITRLSYCEVFAGKESRFIKKQEAIELISSLGIKTPLTIILFEGPLFFSVINIFRSVNTS